MDQLFKILGLMVFTFVTASCSPGFLRMEPTDQAAAKVPVYKVLLGKSSTDKVVAEFIDGNHCSVTKPYVFCREVGMDLLVDSNQIVVSVFLYLNKASGCMPTSSSGSSRLVRLSTRRISTVSNSSKSLV